MTMSNYTNSPLVDVVLLSPNYSKGRVDKKLNPDGVIDKITIHHMAGKLSAETCGKVFQPTSRQASSNYGVGYDGRIGMYVEEKNRAWTSSSRANDIRAVTIEVANDGGSSTGWHVPDAALEATIKLCIDICKRNNIKEINFTGDASGNLTKHEYFAATTCPGPYLGGKFDYIMEQVNLGLGVVDAPEEEETPREEHVVSKMAGKEINLQDCNLYTSSTSARRHSTVSGTFFVWSDEIISGRVKITNKESLVGVSGQVTGWVNYSSIKDQVEGPVIEESVTPSVVPEVVSDPAKWIWDFLKSKGLNDFAIAGIIGNLFAESGLKSNNLQNSYEDDFNHSDESYTAAVDAGVYTNFVRDKAGYGLAQWTYWSRKENLLNFAKSEGKSIGSLSMQMDFFWKEIQGYKNVMAVLTSATSIREASNVMLFEYEAPANQGQKVQDDRTKFGQKYYDKYATPAQETPDDLPKEETPAPEQPPKEEQPTVPETPEAPKTFESYMVKVSISDLRIRKGPGTNYESRGYTGKGTFTIVDEAEGKGASKWGLLKSYKDKRDGWISLDYGKKVGAPASEEKPTPSSTFEKGDTVKIISSAKKWSTGQNIPDWVKMRTLYVRSDVSSNGTCQVSTLKSGAITGVIHIQYLQKV